MFLISVFIITSSMLKSMEFHSEPLTIGIITQEALASCIRSTAILDIGHNITMDTHSINTKEIYQLYKTVRMLDKNGSIDVIVLLDDHPIAESSRHLLAPRNKKLIKWGKEGGIIEMSDKRSIQDINRNLLNINCENDGSHGSQTMSDDPYCVNNFDITTPNMNENIATLVPKLLTSVVLSLSWERVIIFYEKSTEVETSTLVDMLSKKRIMFVMFNIENVVNINALLRNIYDTNVEEEQSSHQMNIVVLCQSNYTDLILREANAFDKATADRKTLMKKFSKWLVVGYGYCRCAASNLQNRAGGLDNVAVVAIPTEFSSSKDFITVFNDILFDVQTLYPHLDDLYFRRTVIDRIEEASRSKCAGFIIETLLWTKNGRSFNRIGHIGRDGHVVLHADIFPNTHYGYNKKEFLISTLPYPPFVMMSVVNGTVAYEGFCIDLLVELSRILNFTYKLTQPKDGLWGSFVSKNTLKFNGLVGQAQRQEVDIIAAPLSDHPERRQVMDFSISFYYEYVSVIFKKPNPNARKWRKLLDPLKWKVLVSIGIALMVVTILTFILEKNNPFYSIDEHAEVRARIGGLHTLPSTFWYLYGALLCQGGVHLPASMTGRTIVSLWWLFCIIIVGTYCGNLIAFLTVTKEVPPFNTLAEMLELKGTYTWGTLGGTSWEMILRTSTNPTFRAVGDAMVEFNRSDPEVLSTSLSEQLDKVRKGGYVWIGDQTSIELEIMSDCDLTTTKEEFMPSKYAFGFTNNSPHESLFSEQLMKIEESGLLQIWKRKWWPNANFCGRNTVTEAKPISLEDVQSAFYVCCIGIGIGIVALMFEIIVHKFHKKKRLSHDNELVNVNSTSELVYQQQ